MDEFYQAVRSLPEWLAEPLGRMPPAVAEQIHELRLREGCSLSFTIGGMPCPAAQISDCPHSLRSCVLTAPQMEEIFYALCGGSVHTHQAELAQGYLTLPGGHRVGVGGQYFIHPQQGVVIQTVRSLNLRVARRKAAALPPELCRALEGHFIGMLLVGEPDSGKTTLLRSAAAFLAGEGRTVTVVDERQEVWPEGGPAGGEGLDVIAGLPKGRALQMALRTLSPHVILLDELGGMEEVEQLEQGFYGGVNFVASLHASTLEEAARRPQVERLTLRRMLRVLVLLEGRQSPGRVKEVRWI